MDNMMNTPGPQNEKKSGPAQQLSKPSSQSDSSPAAGQQGDEDNKTAADGDPNGPAQKSNSPGQTSGNTSDKQEGPSAAGSEEGEKAIKAAAQSKAMGKISELIGKRSEQVTGESMIEVQSGNQKLQTAYKDKAATHGEGAGEVSRDQIPVSVQAYVQEYFQQVAESQNRAPAKAKKPDAHASSRHRDPAAQPNGNRLLVPPGCFRSFAAERGNFQGAYCQGLWVGA